MWALIDCNAFFCSVEKAFHPGLEGKPVCVLSCNDGNIVALTPEAKALGLKRGDPVFRVKDIVRHHDVRLFSSNLVLYAAMSRRVMRIIRKRVQHVEVYSIDEAFCRLDGYAAHFDLEAYMRQLADDIRLFTGIPVSVGIAPSKTLAKMASKYAKQYKGYRSVCMIDTEEKRRRALQLFDLADVWGVGRNSLKRLNYFGVRTPLEFAEKSEAWVKSHFPLPMQRTWRELCGQPCIDTAETLAKQSICTSRSFGEMVTKRDDLKASVAHFAAGCAIKLRSQQSVAGAVTVFVSSNRFREDLPQYQNAATASFLVDTSDTIEITNAALKLVDELFRDGISYKKAGVILTDIKQETAVTYHLFDAVRNRPERNRLMQTLDSINQRYGTQTIGISSAGAPKGETWHSKSCWRTPNYLTDIKELLTVE